MCHEFSPGASQRVRRSKGEETGHGGDVGTSRSWDVGGATSNPNRDSAARCAGRPLGASMPNAPLWRCCCVEDVNV